MSTSLLWVWHKAMWQAFKYGPDLVRLIPQNRFFNIYLHKLVRDSEVDETRNGLTIALTEDYLELITPASGWADRYLMRRRRFEFVRGDRTESRRIILFKNIERLPIPVLLLVIGARP